MGYWKIKYEGKEVTLGDAPMDLMIEAINGIIKSYEIDFQRKPTLEEIKAIFEENVKGYGTDWHSLEEKTEKQIAMLEEITGETDEVSEKIAESITDITGKEFRPEDLIHFKPRDKKKDN